MSFLRKYVRKYGKLFCVAVLFLTLEAFCDLLQPTIMSKVIDDGVAKGSMDKVFDLGGLMLLVTGIGALSASIRNVISSHVSQRFGAEVRSDLFRKIQSLSFERMDRFDRASLVTRLTNDVTQVQNFVNGLMRFFVKAPLLGLGSLIMAVRLDVHLSVVLAVVVPFVAVLIVLNMKIGFPFFIRVQRALDRVNGVMREYLSGVRVVKAFNRFDYEVEKFRAANDELTARSVTSMRVMSVFGPGISLAVNFGIIAVLWLGGLRVDNGQMQVKQHHRIHQLYDANIVFIDDDFERIQHVRSGESIGGPDRRSDVRGQRDAGRRSGCRACIRGAGTDRFRAGQLRLRRFVGRSGHPEFYADLFAGANRRDHRVDGGGQNVAGSPHPEILRRDVRHGESERRGRSGNGPGQA